MFDRDENLKVGQRLKKIRKANNITAVKIASDLGISIDAIYAYEEGTRTVPITVLIKLSKYYNSSIDEILGNSVTYKREKAVSFPLINKKEKTRILFNSEDENIIFYEVDDWTLNYYVKCIDVPFNREVLVTEKGEIYPAIISYDEKVKQFVIFNKKTNSSCIYNSKKFNKEVAVLGDHAGTINKKLKIANFL